MPTLVPRFPVRLVIAITLLLTSSAAALAQGNILLNPGRVILSGSERSAELVLANTGERSVTYRLELVDRRMTAAGGLVEIEEPRPEDRSARAMIRHAPRQITLDGGSRQTVRIFVRKPAGLEPGEYRCHLLLRALPQAGGTNDVEGPDDDSKLAFQVTVLTSLTIPIIVRHGEIERRAALSGLGLAADGPAPAGEAKAVSVRLERAGNSSLYGDLVAVWTPDGGQDIEVSRLSGVAIYPPIEQLDYRLPLRLPEDLTLAGGRLRVRFATHPALDRGAPPVASETELVLR